MLWKHNYFKMSDLLQARSLPQAGFVKFLLEVVPHQPTPLVLLFLLSFYAVFLFYLLSPTAKRLPLT